MAHKKCAHTQDVNDQYPLDVTVITQIKYNEVS